MTDADDAALAAAVFAVDPAGLGGVCLRSLVQPARAQWLETLRSLLPHGAPLCRIPFNIGDDRLLGGLDLTATLRANRPIAERGALAAADGGVVVVAMAERLGAHTAACLNAALDCGAILTQREGVSIRDQARIGLVALDESMAEEEGVPASLLDRLAFLVDLNGLDLRMPVIAQHDAPDIVEARRLLPGVTAASDIVDALCATAMALGAGSLRVSLLALRAARAIAALDGRAAVLTEDAVVAGRLVLAPRATIVPESRQAEPPPAPEESTAEPPADTPPGPNDQDGAEEPPDASEPRPDGEPPDLQDVVLAAAQAAIPQGLLASLRGGATIRSGPASQGRAGALRQGGTRGRPAGIRSGAPRGTARLNVMETLRAAAPWQALRGRLPQGDARVRIAPSDFRVTHYQRRSQTLTIFTVDASGSSALNRLAEAKGAVELLLAECYVRRDQVAVVTFRGRAAELLLPPTRSLVRAKRNLAGVPGGGGTPLAAAIDTALLVATQARRRGDTPIVVLLTDGRANVARNGSGGREAAQADAMHAARRLRQAAIPCLFVDTSPRPNPLAEMLAGTMDARYIPLPFANARSLSGVVTAATARAVR